MKTIQLYQYEELSEDAQKTARETIYEQKANDPYVMECYYQEMKDSMEAIADACSLKTVDYSYGVYCQNYKWHVERYDYQTQYLRGNKALAYFLRVLIDAKYPRPKKFSEMKFDGVCGFSGMCYDENICEAIWESLLDGNTIRQAFDDAAGASCRVLDKEFEYITDPDNFELWEAEYMGECWDEDGNQIL